MRRSSLFAEQVFGSYKYGMSIADFVRQRRIRLPSSLKLRRTSRRKIHIPARMNT